jgi:hypothetical protein
MQQITPKLTNMTEIQMQSSSFVKLWNERPDLRGRIFAINNNSVNRIKGAMNRSMGVIPGVADMVLLIRGGVVWIEWKTPDGKQSKEQVQFQKTVESLGHRYFIVRSDLEFREIIHTFA